MASPPQRIETPAAKVTHVRVTPSMIALSPRAGDATTFCATPPIDDAVAAATSSLAPLSQSRYVKGPPSPIDAAGILSLLTVWWASALIVLGNKRPLQESDIPELPLEDSAAQVFQRFQKEWVATRKEGAPNKPASGSILTSLRRAFGGWFWVAGAFCALSNIFLLLQPVFVQRIVEVLKDSNRSSSEGYLWSMALILTTMGSSLFLNQQFFASIRSGNAVRVACLTAIYEKSLLLSRASRQGQSTGSTVNVMSNDTSRLFDAVLLMHFLWVAPAIIIVALALMVAEVGIAAVAGVVLLGMLSPFQVYISRLLGRTRRKMLTYSDLRVKLTSEVLQGIRVVKLYAWESALAAKIEGIRVEELKQLQFSLYLQALNQTLLFVTPAAVAAVIMCTYSGLGHEVNVSNTFMILAYLNMYAHNKKKTTREEAVDSREQSHVPFRFCSACVFVCSAFVTPRC